MRPLTVHHGPNRRPWVVPVYDPKTIQPVNHYPAKH